MLKGIETVVSGDVILVIDSEYKNKFRLGVVTLRLDEPESNLDDYDDVIIESKFGYRSGLGRFIGFDSGQLVLAHDSQEDRRIAVLIDEVTDDSIIGYRVAFKDPSEWEKVELKHYNTSGLLIEKYL